MSVRTMARVWAESTHSGSHLLMLLAIADFADDDGNAYPSVGTLATKCRMKLRNAQTILATIRASGELVVLENQGPKGTNRYRVMCGQGVQSLAGVQELAGVQGIARGGAKACAKPLQGIAPEPSVNHQEPSKARKRVKPSIQIPDSVLPEWMPIDAWRAYLAHRDGLRKPASLDAQKIAIKKLAVWREDGHDPREILEASVMSGYQGLFPPKSQRSATGKGSALPDDNHVFESTQ